MHKHMQAANNSGGAVYSLGLIGAAFYYLQHASSIPMGLFGIVKAIFWPAFFVYKAIAFFGI